LSFLKKLSKIKLFRKKGRYKRRRLKLQEMSASTEEQLSAVEDLKSAAKNLRRGGIRTRRSCEGF